MDKLVSQDSRKQEPPMIKMAFLYFLVKLGTVSVCQINFIVGCL